MSYALTALLGFCLIAWGFVLVPPAIRLLSGVIRPSDSIGNFRNKMAVLAGSSPSTYMQGSSSVSAPARVGSDSQVVDLTAHRRSQATRADSARRRAARARRRHIFTGLLASVPVTAILAVMAGGAAWMLFLLSVLAFGAYTALLWQMQQNARERRHKVAVLPSSTRPTAQQGRPLTVVAR